MARHIMRQAAAGAVALLALAVPTAASGTSEITDREASEAALLEHFETNDVPEHLRERLADRVIDGEQTLAQQGGAPVTVEEYEQVLDGVPVNTTIERYEDGSFKASHFELAPEEVSESGLATPTSISGCSTTVGGEMVGCTVRMEDTIAWADFRADYTVVGGAARGYGQIHDVYNYAYGAVGGKGLPGGTLRISVAEGNPARAEAQFSWDLPGGVGGGQFSGNLLVDRNGARTDF